MFDGLLFVMFSPDAFNFMRYILEWKTYHKNTGSWF